MKGISLIHIFCAASIFPSLPLQAETSEPKVIIENVENIFPGDHLTPAYVIQGTDNRLLRIEHGAAINTGVEGYDIIKILSSSFNQFAALTSSGQVLTNSDNSNSPTVISEVIDLQAMQGGFAALRSNGKVVSWSDQVSPEKCQSHLSNVKKIITYPQGYGTVAIHGDGTVSAWSYDICSGFSVKNITAIDVAVGAYGFTILDTEGFAYRYPYDTQYLISQMGNVDRIVSGNNYGLSISGEYINCSDTSAHVDRKGILNVATAFGTGMMMLQMSDGSVSQAHCYGSTLNELSLTTLKSLSNIKYVISNYNAFAAIDTAGNLFTWGGYNDEYNGEQLGENRHNVASVIPMLNSFAALKYDGTVIAWGDQMDIKKGSQSKLRNIVGIYPSAGNFLALSKNGTLYMFD